MLQAHTGVSLPNTVARIFRLGACRLTLGASQTTLTTWANTLTGFVGP